MDTSKWKKLSKTYGVIGKLKRNEYYLDAAEFKRNIEMNDERLEKSQLISSQLAVFVKAETTFSYNNFSEERQLLKYKFLNNLVESKELLVKEIQKADDLVNELEFQVKTNYRLSKVMASKKRESESQLRSHIESSINQV